MKVLSFFLLIFISACNMNGPETAVIPTNKFSEVTFRVIYEHQDRRSTDSLIAYLKNDNEKYRELACLALASVQDSLALEPLSLLLKDSSTNVRLATAYALGQLKSAEAASSLLFALAWEEAPVVRKELLEAIGKCASEEQIDDFLDYEPTDSLERAGFAWGLYRAGLRDIITPRMVIMAVSCLYDGESTAARLGAANFLSRSSDLDLSPYQDTVLTAALSERSPNVRMALASAMRHADEDFTLGAIEKILAQENDYRVKINCLRALNDIDDSTATEMVEPMLQAANPNLVQAAADFLNNRLDGAELLVKAANTQYWRARATLVGGAIAKENNEALDFARNLLNSTTNSYEKARLLSALAQDTSSLTLLVAEAFETDNNAVRTAAIQGVMAIRRNDVLSDKQKVDIGEVFKKAIGQGDMAMVVSGATGLRREAWNYKSQFTDFQFLLEAKEKLVLPKDNEILQSLQATIDYFEGNESPTPVTNDFNHPIDWDFVAGIDAEQLVKITTVKGDIILRMLVNEAPGSVANFMALADTGYYSPSLFHRVVPNFVAQGGDPRGDGWGGEDYSIRSELGPQRYQTGSVGMASAGKDTEGVQWFITHSPTPHLDGRYSIFAVVHSGMDVVHQLELGDEISSIERVQ